MLLVLTNFCHFELTKWSRVEAKCIHSKNILKTVLASSTYCEILFVTTDNSNFRRGFWTFGRPKPLFSFNPVSERPGKSKRQKCSIIYDAASKSDAKHSFAVLIIKIHIWNFDFELLWLRLRWYFEFRSIIFKLRNFDFDFRSPWSILRNFDFEILRHP